jgi:hypothetical protein
MKTGLTRALAGTLQLLTILLLNGCLEKQEQSLALADTDAPERQNSPPTIVGTPPNAVMMGNDYQFNPAAADADGDPLVFAIQNQPVWAGFDPATGILSGQPSLADVGIYQNVTIAVSDGMTTVSLPPYTITVTQTSLGAVTLTWTPPNRNADGTQLNDLAGYKVYYGTTSGNYASTIRIDSPGIASVVVENLAPTTYFFVATAFNTSGIESSFSNEAVKIVN